MDTDLDKVIDRTGTGSPKWPDPAGADDGRPALIALSVADMEFAAPPAVRRAVAAAAAHGIFGYTVLPPDHADPVRDHLARAGWSVTSEQIVYTHRVVQAVGVALEVWTSPGDRVLVHTPGYAPLRATVEDKGRVPFTQQLVLREGRYEVDFDALERAFSGGVRALIWCNPHNPTGRVWEPAELERLAALCVRYQVLVISDDVHADFVRPGRTHRFLAGLNEEIARLTMTCTSPGKTFNLPGLEIAHIVLPDDVRREDFRRGLVAGGFHNPSFFADTATRAAYRESGAWLSRVRDYVEGNLSVLRSALTTEIAGLELVEPEGTYLAWVDARGWGLDEATLARLITDQARVAVSWGSSFGEGGDGFFRLNLAAPRTLVTQALERIAAIAPR